MRGLAGYTGENRNDGIERTVPEALSCSRELDILGDDVYELNSIRGECGLSLVFFGEGYQSKQKKSR